VKGQPIVTKIYDQHSAAFAGVSAYVILDKRCEFVAKIAFKYPRDGAGRLYAYVHWLGAEMARGFAAGGGYDKHSAAVSAAATEGAKHLLRDSADPHLAFAIALRDTDGRRWDDRLHAAGFIVLQAV
jgi:hypothetical protein